MTCDYIRATTSEEEYAWYKDGADIILLIRLINIR